MKHYWLWMTGWLNGWVVAALLCCHQIGFVVVLLLRIHVFTFILFCCRRGCPLACPTGWLTAFVVWWCRGISLNFCCFFYSFPIDFYLFYRHHIVVVVFIHFMYSTLTHWREGTKTRHMMMTMTSRDERTSLRRHL